MISIKGSLDVDDESPYANKIQIADGEVARVAETQMSGANDKSRLDSILTSEKKPEERAGSKLRKSLMLNLEENLKNQDNEPSASGLDAIADCESPSYIDKRKA